MKILSALLCLVPAAVGQSQVVTRIVAMEYPVLARNAFIQGKVELHSTITKDGRAGDVRVSAGHPLLAKAAQAMLAEWRFSECADGCEAKFEFTFELSGSCTAGSHCPTGFEVDLPGTIRVTAKAFNAIVN